MPIFEVENRGAYYKSYTDLILSGSPFPTVNGGGVSWGRGNITSKVSGSTDSGTDSRYKFSSNSNSLISFNDFVKEYATPFFDRGDVRNLKITSANSYFEDSRTPEVIQLYLTGTNILTGTIIYPRHSAAAAGVSNKILLLFGRDSQEVTSSNPTYVPIKAINNREFWCSYPFEKKYQYVGKELKVNQVFSLTTTETITGNEPFYIPGNNQVFLNDYSNVTIALTKGSSSIEYIPDWPGYYKTSPSGSPFATPPGNIFQIGGLMKGSFFGNNQYTGYAAVFGINPQFRYKTINSVITMLSGSSNWKFYASYGVEIRGWKYGLYNGVKTKISATYRRNHYGHFRDMLEQRLYTKSFTNGLLEGPLDTNNGINFISGSALAGESNNWLTASIYQSTDVGAAYTVNPYGSGIFDFEYRASQPWHDDDPRIGA